MPIPTRAPGAAVRDLAVAYRLVANLLLYPEERDAELTEGGVSALADAPASLRDPIAAFLASPRSTDADEYLQVLELTPPCPLYLGHYIFEEPQSCRGAGFSGRNGYMLEISAVYRHFGFDLAHGELSDFLPAMAEFLAISLENAERDGIGLRRRFLETYVRPGLAPMRAALAKYDSPYGHLIEALTAAAAIDASESATLPIWKPPITSGQPRVPPVITRSSGRKSLLAEGSMKP